MSGLSHTCSLPTSACCGERGLFRCQAGRSVRRLFPTAAPVIQTCFLAGLRVGCSMPIPIAHEEQRSSAAKLGGVVEALSQQRIQSWPQANLRGVSGADSHQRTIQSRVVFGKNGEGHDPRIALCKIAFLHIFYRPTVF